LTDRVAEHFVQWMANPPVAFFVNSGPFTDSEFPTLKRLAGDVMIPHHDTLLAGLAGLASAMPDPDAWELSTTKP
jgi:hypothetical protein